MATVLITGGTGLVGSRLTEMLIAKGYEIIIVSRNTARKSSHPAISYANWNVATQTIDTNALAKADYIVHLAGAGVADERWTKNRKEEIVNSRTQSSALLVKALKENVHYVKAVISASAIGWYGANLKETSSGFEEINAPATDFLGNTCKLWEQSIEPVEQLGIRLVKLRTGIVLSANGGALKEFLKPIRFFVAAVLGNGKQIISWIHINDLCNQFIYAIENNSMQGSYNAVAPNPVTNKQLTLQIAKQLKGNFFITVHVPAFILKIVLGEMSIEVLKSTTVSSKKIEQAGFTFSYPTSQQAISNLV